MSSCSGTIPGYYVEAMTTYPEPQTFGGQIFSGKWKRVHFNDTVAGVPKAAQFQLPIMILADCYSYEAAQALRWWFHAEAAPGFCLQSRIVKCEIKYSVETERVSEHCVIGGDDRSNCMPDWGKKSG